MTVVRVSVPLDEEAAAEAAGVVEPPRAARHGGAGTGAALEDGTFADDASTADASTEEERRWAEAVLDSHGVDRQP